MKNNTFAAFGKSVGQGKTSVEALSSNPEKAQSAASERIAAVVADTLGKEIRKADELERKRQEAMAVLLPKVLTTLSEDARNELFGSLMCLGSKGQRNLIGDHPLCPANINEAVEEFDKARAEAAAAEKARRQAEIIRQKRARLEKLQKEIEEAEALKSGDETAVDPKDSSDITAE